MISTFATTLVVSKHNNSQHASIHVPEVLPALGESSVRVRTRLIAATSNNLSYARGGFVLHWWDTYPVPSHAPQPYNNQNDWGIVPAWGYGEIIESTIKELPPGRELFGYWPMSTLPVDLKLEAFEPKGHWRETSKHRQQLMPLYNRYTLSVETTNKPRLSDELKGWHAVLDPLFGAAYQLNRYVFPGALNAPSLEPIHPSGKGQGQWTREDGDLTSAVFVSLSAATKTARGFASQFLHNRDVTNHGPLGFLQVTRDVRALDGTANFPSKICNYEDLNAPAVLSWIASLNPKRIVMVDFGAGGNVAGSFIEAVTNSPTLSKLNKTSFTFIGLGNEMRALSGEEVMQKLAIGQSLGRIQFNSSTLRDAGVEIEGAEAYFANQDRAFEDWIRNVGPGNLKLTWGHGIEGPEGLAGVWEALCAGSLAPEKACVFKL